MKRNGHPTADAVDRRAAGAVDRDLLARSEEVAVAALGRPWRWVHAAGYATAVVVVLGVVGAWCVRIEPTISARGVVRTTGGLVSAEPAVEGRVTEIAARVGQVVAAGELLFRLDDSDRRDELARLADRRERLAGKLLDEERRASALRAQHEQELRLEAERLAAADGEVALSERAEQQAAIDIERLRVDQREARDEVARLEKLGTVVRAVEVDAARSTEERARAAVSSAEWSRETRAQETRASRRNRSVVEHQQELAQRYRERELVDLEAVRNDLETELDGLRRETERTERALDEYVVRAPVDGRVTALAHRLPGSVVAPGEALASLAPVESPWIVEAWVPDHEAGELAQRIGGRARFKVDAFPFRRYGVVEGELLSVSPHAFDREGVGPAFRVEIGLAKLELVRGDRTGALQLGMSGTVEILRAKRRLLELLLPGDV